MSPIKIAVCASGEGSNFQAIVEASRRGDLRAEVVGLLTNRGKIGALGRALHLNVESRVVSPGKYKSRSAWDQAMAKQLEAWGAEWVVLAGFLALIGPKVLAKFPDLVINSHPSLLPKYGGAGMYGERVFEAVVAAGERETGVTFHLVNARFDEGRVLHQVKIPVLAGESAAQLAERVKLEENRLYPKVLNDLIHNPS